MKTYVSCFVLKIQLRKCSLYLDSKTFFQYFYCNNKITGKLGKGSIRPSLFTFRDSKNSMDDNSSFSQLLFTVPDLQQMVHIIGKKSLLILLFEISLFLPTKNIYSHYDKDILSNNDYKCFKIAFFLVLVTVRFDAIFRSKFKKI